MGMRVNWKKAVLLSAIVYVIDAVIGNLLWLNPLVTGISAAYAGHPGTRSIDYFGGIGNWLALNMLFSLVLIGWITMLFVVLYPGLPGQGWQKGIFFGLMLATLKAVPEAFNQFMIFDYPTIMIVIQLINTSIGMLVIGLALALVSGWLRVFEPGQAEATTEAVQPA